MKSPIYSNAVIVSRFDNFRDFLVELGLVGPNTPVYSRVDRNIIKGKTVIGRIPNHIASFADSIVHIQYRKDPEGKYEDVYSVEDLLERFVAVHEYVVTSVDKVYKEQLSDNVRHRDVSKLDASANKV